MVKIKLLSLLALNAIFLTISAQTTTTTPSNINSPNLKKKVRNSKILHVIPYRDENSVKMPEMRHDSNIHSVHNEMKLNRHNSKGNALNNAAMLETLGLSKLTIPPNHHRKRLAVESRHHSRPDDSHMFVIKLPPNPYYYSYSKQDKNSIHDYSKHVPVGFKSNGKPGKIYHWNIPVLKKIYGSTQGHSPNMRHADDSEFYDIKNIPTWSAKSSWDNDTMDKKAISKLAKENDKILKKKSPTYYAPKPRNIHNHFAGNGKPQSFYVIEKSHKPAKYHKLIS